MKNFKIITMVGCVAIAALISLSFKKNAAVSRVSKPGSGFAVIELFTSEGCSSCPPADELVARIEKEVTDKPVYILAFHVDYWNRLGWKDVFSSAEYSQRQHQYAQWLHVESVYTPQIVVNGHTEFVGSEEGNLRNAIKAGLQKTSTAALTIGNVKVDKDKATLQYHSEGADRNSTLILALVQKHAQTKVKNGENGGRTLSHVQIVRELQNIALNGRTAGNENISLPANFDANNWELIAFLQNAQDGQIIAAAKSTFVPTGAMASAAINN
jgi:hypothetical protein